MQQCWANIIKEYSLGLGKEVQESLQGWKNGLSQSGWNIDKEACLLAELGKINAIAELQTLMADQQPLADLEDSTGA